ncbi:MAG: hypothetical protein JXB49_05605 [Bacteroidales bacterium]|nr:hypothetical protein [Bacteroidales bacterium]MBN2818799.1 hypothetical protein [Bacteroidales bacterium]
MTHNDIFDLNRFQLFFRRHLFLNYKGMLTAFSAISGALIVIAVLTSIGSGILDQESFIVISYVSLFLGGAIITSVSFSEMHKPEKSIQYLSLPASAFEKIFSTWLTTTVIFLFVAVAFFYAAWYVASTLAFFLTDSSFVAINFFNAALWKIIGIYFVVQPVFFLGAIYFKGYNFLKTLLALFVISVFQSMFQTLMGLFIFGSPKFFESSSWDGLGYLEDTLLPIIKIFGFYVLPTFLLIVSYIRFKEREV